MQSLTTAAALLAASDQPDALAEILAELGFFEPPLPLDALACERLGLPYGVLNAQVTRAEGTLRALILTTSADVPPREVLAKIAGRFATRVPHLLWLVIVFQQDTSQVAFATWGAQTTPPRVAALVADRSRIVDSDAETLCALAACAAVSNDVMRHTRWLEVLGREAVTQRFYRTLERMVVTLAESLDPRPSPEEARELSLLYISRLLFLSFLETKGWLNHDFAFLINGFADCMANGGRYQQRLLTPLFFGTLNTRPTARATRAHAFGKIPFLNGGLFSRTALERRLRTATFTDEALGMVYSDLLARYRFTAREDTTMWSEAAVDPEMLGKAFESLMVPQERKRSGSCYTPQPLVERITTMALIEALQSETVHRDIVEQALAGTVPDQTVRGVLLDRTSSLRVLDPACGSGTFLVHALEQIAALRARLGDIRPIAAIRRSVLTTSIYGVDINPMAVWLCELRLWLSTVIESAERDPMRVLPLPNIDHQIHVGDTLTGGSFEEGTHPHSAEVAERGGFDVIIGNPPWVRLHHIAGQIDMAVLFLERSIDLLAPQGIAGLLLPAKLWRSLAGGGARRLVQARTQLIALEDLSDSATAFNAAVYPSILIARKTMPAISAPSDLTTLAPSPMVTAIVHRTDSSVQWRAPMPSFALDPSPGSPWLLIPPAARTAFDTVSRAGTFLTQSIFGRPYLGVKSGCNDAFLVHETGVDGERVSIKDDSHDGEIERTQLRPLARGETVRRWIVHPTNERIIWTHDVDGDPLTTLPPLTQRWLTRWRTSLERRSDLRGSSRWWSLFRTDSADATYARVIWSDFGKSPRAAVLAPGDPTVPLNTCYVVRCPTLQDAYAFAALLNAPLTAAWLGAIAEPARGGHRRHLGWTMSLLPIPRDWARARTALAPLAERGIRGEPPTGDELHAATLYAYRLRADSVEPLLVWDAR